MDQIFDKIEITDLRPIRDIVFEKLRVAIINETLERGERLVETSIAESMGVSRTPVREALRQLEVEGLAENIPRKGTIVKGISKKDIIEIYEIREVLEGLEFRLACRNISEVHITELKEKISIMEKCIANNNVTEYWRVHGEWDNIILYSCRNGRLIDDIKRINEYLLRLRKITLVMDKRRSKAMEEFKELLEAFGKRDEALSEEIGRKHAVNAEKFLAKEINLF